MTVGMLFWRAKEWAYGKIKQVVLKGQYDLKCNLEQSLGSRGESKSQKTFSFCYPMRGEFGGLA